jgi:hypothetical protein
MDGNLKHAAVHAPVEEGIADGLGCATRSFPSSMGMTLRAGSPLSIICYSGSILSVRRGICNDMVSNTWDGWFQDRNYTEAAHYARPSHGGFRGGIRAGKPWPRESNRRVATATPLIMVLSPFWCLVKEGIRQLSPPFLSLLNSCFLTNKLEREGSMGRSGWLSVG